MRHFLRTFLKKLPIVMATAMILGCVPAIRLQTDENGHRHVEVGLVDSPFAITAKAADGDPLQSVATVTTNGNVSDYVDIDSTYTPSGYTTPATQSSEGYKPDPGTLSSYHTDTYGTNDNQYLVIPTDDLSWTTNSSNTGVNGSLSATARSDYLKTFFGIPVGNGAMCAKANSKVIRIYASSDITLSFDWTVSMKMTKWQGTKAGSIQEGVYALVTTSSAPTVSQLQAGTEISRKKLTENSPTEASDSGDDWTTALEAGQYLYLYFFGFFNNEISGASGSDKYTFSASVTDFKITPATESYSLSVGNCDCANNLVGGGKIAVNGSSITIPSAGTVTGLSDALSGTAVELSVSQAPSGYMHIGWQIDGSNIFEKEYSFSLNENKTIYALFIPQVTVTMGNNGYSNATYSYKNPSGTTINGADQYIARNSEATSYYKTLAEAFSANDVVVLLGNSVLNGDFTVPTGKTLSVQYDWKDPATSELQHIAGSTAASVFAKVIINGTVTLQGKLVASANQSYTDSVNGRAAGGIGHIIVNGTINIPSGGSLHAYGIITGPGQINVASGGTVYELMEARDMRSVQVLPNVASSGAFPFNHFFIKTNEVKTTYSKGAMLVGCYYIAISGIRTVGEISVIGTSNSSLFIIDDGSITKFFSSDSSYNNKTVFRVESGSIIQTGHFSFSIKVSTFSKTIDTANYELPLNYCYAIEVMNGGSLTMSYNYKLLPGATIDIKEGGTATIASGKKLILYRANDYKFTALSGFSATAYPTAFTKPIGLNYAQNTAANVGSAKLNVDGTLNVAGGLYVTNQLSGNTTYSNGYNILTGTGTINFTKDIQSNGTIKEWTQSDSQSATSVTVAYVPFKGITNYDAATDDGQTDYNSLYSNTNRIWYGYINDSNVNVWSASAPAILSYDANGGTGNGSPSRPCRHPWAG